MKTAWLVVNGYLKSEKFEEIYSWLIEAAKERNINLNIFFSPERLMARGP